VGTAEGLVFVVLPVETDLELDSVELFEGIETSKFGFVREFGKAVATNGTLSSPCPEQGSPL
jgi:hypothetical protein